MTKVTSCIASVAFYCVACAQSVETELYESIVNGETERLTLFLDAGGDPSALIRIPQSAGNIALLELAVRTGNEDATTLLLRAGVQPDDTVAFLEMAAEKGFADVVGALLDEDPALIARMRPDNHPLLLAVAGGHAEVASEFLEKMQFMPGRAAVGDVLDQALLVAVAKHDRQQSAGPLIMKLIDAGADPISTTALAGAVLSCDPALITTFLTRGADARRAYDVGRGPANLVEYAVRCFETAPDNAKLIVRELASAGSDPCALDLADPRVPAAARRYLRENEGCSN